MFSIALVASLVLPSVLGGCCFPQKMSTMTYTALSHIGTFELVDFSQNKMISRPMGHQTIDFVLQDLATNIVYTQNLDKSCTFKAGRHYAQCLPDFAVNLGSGILGGMQGIDTDNWEMKADNIETMITVTKDGCLPMVGVTKIGKMIETKFFVNVTTSVTDVSDLDQDVSACVDEASITVG